MAVTMVTSISVLRALVDHMIIIYHDIIIISSGCFSLSASLLSPTVSNPPPSSVTSTPVYVHMYIRMQ